MRGVKIIQKTCKKEVLNQIKTEIENNIGRELEFKTKITRNKREVFLGKIENVYPNFFTILVAKEDGQKTRSSYSYIDLLIKEIEIKDIYI